MKPTRERATELARLDHQHAWHPFTPQARWTATPPLMIERAEGAWLIDTDGNHYLDGVSSMWTNVHGHRHPRLDAAVREQLDRVAHSTFQGLSHPPGVELAKRLVDAAPWGLQRVFYSDNGSTATEVALKMAFRYHQQRGTPQRTRFAVLSDAYHGDTTGAVSVGDIPSFHRVYKPLLFDALALPAPTAPGGDEERGALARALALIEAHGDELAAVIVEPLVQCAAGMKMHSPAYLATLLKAARAHGALLIADEIAVGFGRTGTLFAMEQVGVPPDFLCLANGLAAGYLPLAATLTTDEVYAAFLGAPESHRPFFHAHAFTANPLACAVANASLDLFEEDGVLATVLEHARHLHALLDGWANIAGVAAVRHRGMLVGIDLERPDGGRWEPATQMGHRVCMRARQLGAVLRPLGDTIVLSPPLTIPDGALTQLVAITAEAIRDEVAAG